MIPAILVTGRYWGRALPFLNMYSNAKELISPADTEAKPDTSWVSASATFTGSAYPLVDDQNVEQERKSVTLEGGLSIAETSTHHYLLFASHDAADPAVWISAPHGALDARMDGSVLAIAGDGWRLTARDVGRLFVSTNANRLGRYTPGQEGVLLTSLCRPGAGAALPVLPFSEPTDQEDWRPTTSGIFVQVDGGEPTGLTALSSPRTAQRERLAHLLRLSWLPLNVLARQYRLRIGDQEPARWSEPAPQERSWPPVADAFVALSIGPRETNEVAEHLWPHVGPDGRPVLTPGESTFLAWSTTGPEMETVDAQGDDDLPYPLMPTKAQPVDCSVTNGRLIMVGALSDAERASLAHARADSPLLVGKKMQPGLLDTGAWDGVRAVLDSALDGGSSNYFLTAHIRWEWLAAVARHTEVIQREERSRGIFGKKTVVTITVAWLQLDVLLPDGSRRRLHLKARNEEAPALDERLRTVLTAVKESGAAVASEPEVTSRPLMHGHATTERWSVTGTPGYSIPRVDPCE
jgi:hypothetical protein